MKGKRTLMGIVTAVLAVVLAVSLTSAQGPGTPLGGAPEGGDAVDAVGAIVPIQGRLTSASGVPLNGNYSITASLYTAAGGGAALCSDTDTVAVTNGLFKMDMHNCGNAVFNGQQLYLGIKVGADDEMTPRQAIYPVPYARSLRPGAVVEGTGNVLTIRGSSNDYAALFAHDQSANGGYGAIGRSEKGIGLYGDTKSTESYGVVGFQTGYSTGDYTGTQSGGLFGGRFGVVGISKDPGGRGVYGWNKATTGANAIGVRGRTDSADGWAGFFSTAAGNGVYVSAPAGKTGLNVAGGTKSAVVRAEGGSRLLYSEESTGVWFTDYGFGRLQNGVATIAVDPLFAQTVNLNEPYHVFVQPYGDAYLYVANRTPTGFEVRLHDGDPNAEFSYRIVARRLGYETTRLERAPWADNDPNLYPEQGATWEAEQGGAP